jgi:hypothetical protein
MGDHKAEARWLNDDRNSSSSTKFRYIVPFVDRWRDFVLWKTLILCYELIFIFKASKSTISRA